MVFFFEKGDCCFKFLAAHSEKDGLNLQRRREGKKKTLKVLLRDGLLLMRFLLYPYPIRGSGRWGQEISREAWFVVLQ